MTMEERLTLYALDALPADEKAAFEAELAASETLRARLAEERGLLLAMDRAIEPMAPSAEMTRNLMARVDADIAARAPRPVVARRRWADVARWLWPAMSLGFAALAVVFGVWAVSGQAESARLRDELALLTGPGVRAANIPPAQKDATATATAFVARGAPNAVLLVANLPALDPLQTYQAWIIRDGKPLPAGVFNTGPDGQARLVLRGGAPFSGAEQIGVTIERAGGSDTPDLKRLVFIGPLT
ncbi:MAG: anti-sigma factor [Burkholderiaceae bacterium]|nr:anti-sigma factor [Burkholderiaceae bacterium]